MPGVLFVVGQGRTAAKQLGSCRNFSINPTFLKKQRKILDFLLYFFCSVL